MDALASERDMDLTTAPGENPEPVLPTVWFDRCPIAASLGVLGKRWTLLILRDLAFFGPVRFSTIQRHNPGLGPRTLSLRLRELRAEGLIERQGGEADGEHVTYTLSEKGRDIVPVLAAFIQFGAKHHAGRVFADGAPRSLGDLFPGRQEMLLGRLMDYAIAPSAAPERASPSAASAGAASRR